MSSPHITYAARPDATPEAELDALATIYKFLLFDSQARKGDPRDLTSDSTKKRTTSTDKKGTDNADIHGD
jgi:hypothetical protein